MKTLDRKNTNFSLKNFSGLSIDVVTTNVWKKRKFKNLKYA